MQARFKLFIFSAFLLTLSIGNNALAISALTSNAAESFVSSLTDVNMLASEMKQDGKDNFFEANNEPVPGEKFEPYSGALPELKKQYPAEYKKLGNIIENHGFASQESWASTGDKVMLAYIASKMPIPAAAAMPQIPAGMEHLMPPEAKAEMAKGLAALKTIRDVPQAHKDIVAPLIPQIDQWIAAQSAE